MQQLKKVDFFWINRDQNSFEWFLKLLLEIENEQTEIESSSQQVCPEDKNLQGDGRFMNIHLYFTQALQSSDIRAVGMQLAMDLLRTKVLFWSISHKLLFILKKGNNIKTQCCQFSLFFAKDFFILSNMLELATLIKGLFWLQKVNSAFLIKREKVICYSCRIIFTLSWFVTWKLTWNK